jgi:hypothetical protein
MLIVLVGAFGAAAALGCGSAGPDAFGYPAFRLDASAGTSVPRPGGSSSGGAVAPDAGIAPAAPVDGDSGFADIGGPSPGTGVPLDDGSVVMTCDPATGPCRPEGGALPTVDVFAGAPSFVSQTGGSSHNAGRDCMQCHATGGGDAPMFTFGGTLYDGHGNPVAGAEIRVVDGSGHAISAHTGPEGNFHGSGTLTLPGHAGARNANGSEQMLSALTSGGCNMCHCTGSTCATAPLHLP